MLKRPLIPTELKMSELYRWCQMSNFKFRFDDLEYQKEAIDSALDIFQGQRENDSNFTVVNLKKGTIGYGNMEGHGTSNALPTIMDEEIVANLEAVQIRNSLESDKNIDPKELLTSLDFTVEMETGTGKTYVYIKTILELNKRYGFKKFIIVVPSVAIREGVKKSFEITKQTFETHYNPYKEFVYDSNNISDIRSFVFNKDIQIMVMNIGAFNSKDTNFNKPQDAIQGNKPLDLVRQTRPIVIIDEPQSVLGADKKKESAGRKAVKGLNPLMVFRYSATHRDKTHEIYRLDAVDAYEKKLVKEIAVSSVIIDDDFNSPYIYVVSIDREKKTAKLRLNEKRKEGYLRVTKVVRQDDSLYSLTNNDLYDGFNVKEIFFVEGKEYINISNIPHKLNLDDKREFGATDSDAIKRFQIKETIREHLEKEVSYRVEKKRKGKQGRIKVLSLFFIDRVHNYVNYQGDERVRNGKYALMFEEEYVKELKRRLNHEKDSERKIILEDLAKHDISKIHNGYFSNDKKNTLTEYTLDKEGNYKNTKKDDDTFKLIMQDKEKLLDLNHPLRFIFSHSALKEGWDNPNVFQICTLNESKSVIKKRQEIGRGLRLAVDEYGNRIYDTQVNRLTVMANESYEEFAENLQKELSEDGIRFGVVESDTFVNIRYKIDGEPVEIGGDSLKIYHYLQKDNYIDEDGKITDDLRRDLRDNKFELPTELYSYQKQVMKELTRLARTLEIHDANKREKVKRNSKVFNSPEFLELWDKIKYKTRYELKFNMDKLREMAISRIQKELYIPHLKITSEKAEISLANAGVLVGKRKKGSSEIIYVNRYPNILVELQNSTRYSRTDIAYILEKSGRLSEVKNNPQKFLLETTRILNKTMNDYIAQEQAIKYVKLGDEQCYVQENVFKDEIEVYIDNFMEESEKSLYSMSNYDSKIEKALADNFEQDENVKFYVKLPRDFKIDTPLGLYNPDWAVLYNDGEVKKLYFVLESKGTVELDQLGASQKSKIDYAKEHFSALNEGVKEADSVIYEVVSDYESFENLVEKI